MRIEHNYQKLKVWHKTQELIKEIYQYTQSFPESERFGLTDQIRRAGVSIGLNIAEGSSSGTNNEFIRFINISIRSAREVTAALEISDSLGFGS